VNYIGETLKIELDDKDLNIVIQAMGSANIKGSDAVMYGKLLEKFKKAFDKELAKNANL
jgi:hypothetical protein